MDVNDKYLLEIKSSAEGIGTVAGDLEKLKSSLKGFTFSPAKVTAFTNFSNSITTFSKAVSNIETGKITAFASAMTQLSNVKVRLPKGMDETVKNIEKAFTGLGDSKELYKKVNSFSRIMKPLADLKFGGIRGASDAVKGLETALGSLDFRKIHGEADALNRTLAPLASTMEKLSSASVNLGFNKSFGKGIGNAYQGLQDVLSSSTKKSGSTKGAEEDTKSLGDRFGELKSKAQVAFTAIVQGAKRVASAMKSIAGVVGKVVTAVSNIGFLNPFRGIAESITNVIKKLKTLWSSLARIAMYRALRSAIKEISKAIREGLTNLYYWSQATGGDFAPAVDDLATSMLYLKNSFGAMVSPIITAFTPAIHQATDAIVNMLNVVNQLLARLTGRATWTRALRYPTEFAERASGATKKVKDNIQDFDELHILRTPNGGGGASGMDYNNMFEETEFTEGLTNWVENFKTALRNGRFYDAGNILADEINGVINRVPWARLGDNLARKVNDMFQFAWGVLHNIDFVNIGSSIATFFNHAIESIDAHTIGMVLARKWTMIFDTLYGFVSTFDFPAFGWRLSELVEGWFDEIDGARIGTTISNAIKGALDAAIAFLSNDSMLDKFVEDIANLINNVDWYGIFVRIVDVGTRVLNALADTINRVIDGSGRSSSTSQYDFSSAPTAIAQRMQAQVSGYTGGYSADGRAISYLNRNNQNFGDMVVGGMTDSVNNADISALIDAFKNLINAVWRAIKTAFGEKYDDFKRELSIKIRNLLPHHWFNDWTFSDENDESDENSTWVAPSSRSSTSSTSGSSTTAHRAINGRFLKGATRETDRYTKSLGSADRATRTLVTDTTTFSKTIDSVNVGMKTTASDVVSVQSSFDTFGSKLSGEVVSKVMSAKSTITSSFASMKDEATNSLSSLTANVVASMENTANTVTAPLQGIKRNIVSVFHEAGEESARSIASLSTRMSGALNGLVESSRAQLEGYTSKWNELHGATKGVSNSVIIGAEKMANAVIDAFNSLQDATGNIKIDIPNYKFQATGLHKLNHITIPKLATGGIVSSPTTALIGEAGREAVLPLENNTDWMNTLADRINGGGEDEVALLREQNELLRQIASKNVTISSRDVFNAVRDENSDYITRTGQNALAF